MTYLLSLRKILTDELKNQLTRLETMTLLTENPVPRVDLRKTGLWQEERGVYLTYWHRYKSVWLTVCPLTTTFVP